MLEPIRLNGLEIAAGNPAWPKSGVVIQPDLAIERAVFDVSRINLKSDDIAVGRNIRVGHDRPSHGCARRRVVSQVYVGGQRTDQGVTYVIGQEAPSDLRIEDRVVFFPVAAQRKRIGQGQRPTRSRVLHLLILRGEAAFLFRADLEIYLGVGGDDFGGQRYDGRSGFHVRGISEAS